MKGRILVGESAQMEKFEKKPLYTNINEIHNSNLRAIEAQKKVFISKKHVKSVTTKSDCQDSLL